MGKIIFVGIHNKPGLKPLDSFTKSGKLIDRIIFDLFTEGFLSYKTNLYDTQIMPDKGLKKYLSLDWWTRNRVDYADVIVLLGKEVQLNFIEKKHKVVKLPHPSRIWSRENKDKYVNTAVKLIKLAKNNHRSTLREPQGDRLPATSN